MKAPLKLKHRQKIYFIGIKGNGMSSLAVLLKKMDHTVSGSDTPETFLTEVQLKSNRVRYHNGFDPAHLDRDKPDLVIFSTAYGDANPEIARSKQLKLATITYAEAVGLVSQNLVSIAICGSHGKTTTTSMLGSIMQSNGRTATLTGTVADSINQKQPKDPKYFVFEADEYQNKFQYYAPAYVILNNIDFDHPDYFSDAKHYKKTFADFIRRTLKSDGFVAYNYDDLDVRSLLGKNKTRSTGFGFSPGAEYRIAKVNPALNEFSVLHNDRELMRLKLKVYGKHNILDATAAAVMAHILGITPNTIEGELKKFSGIQRRMQSYPSKKYILIDDYGHHPTEIAITLQAIRNKYPNKKIITVFQPHTFTRTKALLSDFGKAFKSSDLTIILDIFGSARESHGGVHTQDVVSELQKNGTKAKYISTVHEVASYIKKNIPHGAVIISMGAGDAWKIHSILDE